MASLDLVKSVFAKAAQVGASDLHLLAFESPIIRVDGDLRKLTEIKRLSSAEVESTVLVTLRPEFVERLKGDKEVDFSFNFDGSRVRANVYFERGRVAASYRFITEEPRTFEQLGLPPILREFGGREQGLVIVTGPTGHGKSTTIAAIINHVNNLESKHIITVEDPIEYVFKNRKSIISQRELGSDTYSFSRALRSALREDPDVVFIGEMRDQETFEAALSIAETGHLVLTTLHTNDAAQAPDRIIDVFPRNQQVQVRQQLSNVLAGVISQRLIQKASRKGRIAACEVMIANQAIKSLIREDKTYQIQTVIQTSASEGMITLDKVLADYVSRGEITLEEAIKWTNDVKQFKQMVF